MKRLASIDIGTNTALLLAAEISPQFEIFPLVQHEKIVRLGEGVDERRLLKPAAIQRTLEALEEYVHECRDLKMEGIVISGTSAVRDAQNRDELIDKIKQAFGIEMRVLSGEEEAQLTYFGALSNKEYLAGDILLIDIGGGSTEFITGTLNSITKAVSIDVGSVRLTERFIRHDPISEVEFSAIENFIDEQLRLLRRDFVSAHSHFVGVAGTVTTLAAMQLRMAEYDPEKVDSSHLTFQQAAELVDDLKRKSLAEMRQLPGLSPKRADVILAGAMILWQVMREFGFEEVTVSDRGLRFGVLMDFAKNKFLPESH